LGGFWLGHLAISDAGTFSRLHRWVFVGPCHLCVHGPPAFPFDSGFLTHTHIYIYAQERQKERRERREERGGRREERGTHSHALTNELTDIHPNVYQHNPKCEKANAKINVHQHGLIRRLFIPGG